MTKTPAPLVRTDPQKCKNCRRCIAVCPPRFANRAADGHIAPRHERCIGCGRCIFACSHGARQGIDDLDRLMTDLEAGVPVVAVVSPAVAANFPDLYRNLNGWLLGCGVSACYDASFGTALAIRSLFEVLANVDHSGSLIPPFCSAVVEYCRLHCPVLLPHLAPIHSPMGHALLMLRLYLRRFSRHRLAVITPCLAVRREMAETGLGEYAVSMSSLTGYFQKHSVHLEQYPSVEYSSPPSGIAVVSPSPGSLARIFEHAAPGIGSMVREVYGVAAFPYLAGMAPDIASGAAPFILDCRACVKGCNGGPGAPMRQQSIDCLDRLINTRWRDEGGEAVQQPAKSAGLFRRAKEVPAARAVEEAVAEFWEQGLYRREYTDLSSCGAIPEMDVSAREEAMRLLGKRDEGDFINCTGCGYNSCESMLRAIHCGIDTADGCVRRDP